MTVVPFTGAPLFKQAEETQITIKNYRLASKKDTQSIPPLKRKNGKGVAQLDLKKAEEFNGQFADVQ